MEAACTQTPAAAADHRGSSIEHFTKTLDDARRQPRDRPQGGSIGASKPPLEESTRCRHIWLRRVAIPKRATQAESGAIDGPLKNAIEYH
jgi:hypothetical protein